MAGGPGSMRRWFGARCAAVAVALVTTAAPARAQQVDVTFYGGPSLPFYEGAIKVRPNIPSLPGLDIEPESDLLVTAGGGLVFGGSVAWQPGILGIEGRIDTADLGLETDGMRFNVLLGGRVPVGSVSIDAGNWDMQRLVVLSVNARIRTPGSLSLIASGGLSYLPSFEVSGAVPMTVSVPGLITLPAVNVGLELVAAPGQPTSALGGNAGGGVGIKLGPHTTLLAEGRMFGFGTFDLDFAADVAGAGLEELVGSFPIVQFKPGYFQAGVGLIVSF